MFKQNLGTVDRVLRFALAVWWLGPWAPEYKNESVNWVMFIVAWIALVESFISYCWLHEMLGLGKKHE